MRTEDRNLPKLRAALLADDWAVRFNAGLDLVKLVHVDGIPALIEGLGHQSRVVRNFHAGTALISLGDNASPALAAELESTNIRVRSAAANILQQIDGAGADEFLSVAIDVLDSDDSEAKSDAYALLGRIGEGAHRIVPRLTATLRKPVVLHDPQAWEEDQRHPMTAVLARISKPIDQTTAALVESLDHDDCCVRGLAAYALKLINTPQTTELVKDAERQGRVLPFEPRVEEHLLPQVDVVYDEPKLLAFEGLYERTIASGQGSEIEYDLSYPKHEFMRFLVEFKGLLMHGSNSADIKVMNPVRFSTDAGAPGNVSGVYAAKDHLQPLFFAIVNRRRCFGLTNGFVDRKEDGAFTSGEEEVGVHSRFYYLSIDYKGLLRDP